MPKIITTKYDITVCSLMLVAVLCLPVTLLSQSARKVEQRADADFKNQDYYNAARLYSAILYDSPLVKASSSIVYPFQPGSQDHVGKIRQSKRSRVMYKLAESYRLYNHYKDASVQYEQYLASKDTHFPLASLWYGLCLIANDEPQKGIDAFTSFLQKYKIKDGYAEKARQGIASCNFIISNRLLKPRAVISKLESAVSEDGSNFALEKINDSIFWFTTSRHELDKKKEKIYPVRLYTGNFNSNTVAQIAAFVANDMNMAASSLTSDGLTVYFTGWKEDAKTGTTSYAVFYMSRAAVDSPWTAPVMLPAPVNIKGFHSKQPYISRDGKYLLFSSNQPEGYGKFDIWMVEMDGRKPIGSAINLGSKINTQADEVTPFYDADSDHLYFSSEGRIGMGGMDIYETTGILAQNQWNDTIRNLGPPLNSVRDDEYYRKERGSDTAYLSSDRASSCCLEIFRAVQVKYIDTLKNVDRNIPLVQNKPAAQNLIPSISEEEKTNQHLMDSINAITVTRRYVNYNFASARIRYVDRPQLNDIVQVLEKNPELNILVASFTDCIGPRAANILLSRKRSESVKAYLISKGIASTRINIDFFGKEHFVMACKEDTSYNTSKQIANRRSDLILTKEAKPKWLPSGRELDINNVRPTVYDRLVYDNLGGRKNDAAFKGAETKMTHKPAENVRGYNRSQTDKTETAIDNNSIGRKDNRSAKNKKPVQVKKNQLDETTNGHARETKNIVTEKLPVISKKSIPRKDTVVLQHKLPITELLDLTPRLKEADVIDEMTKRIPRKPIVLYSTSDSVRIDLYDNGVFDYDTVSVIYNKHLAAYKQLLQVTKPITFYVKLNADQSKNEMIFFAENLGLTPPNSALMIITDGENKRTEVNVASDLEHNTVIYFIKVNKHGQ